MSLHPRRTRDELSRMEIFLGVSIAFVLPIVLMIVTILHITGVRDRDIARANQKWSQFLVDNQCKLTVDTNSSRSWICQDGVTYVRSK